MGRGGRKDERLLGAERKCIASGETLPKASLLRFVVSPDGELVPDMSGKLPGRGLYVKPCPLALEKAVSKNLFGRAARQPVKVASDLVERVDTLCSKRVVDLLALSRKAGLAVSGYEKVKATLDAERAQVLLQASDGSTRGKSKLSTPHFGTYIGWLTAQELGWAFGRQTVIHAALSSGGLTRRVVEEALKLRGLRQPKLDEAAKKDRRA